MTRSAPLGGVRVATNIIKTLDPVCSNDQLAPGSFA